MKRKSQLRKKFAWYQSKARHDVVDTIVNNMSLILWKKVSADIDKIPQGVDANNRSGLRVLTTGLLYRMCLMNQARDIQASVDDVSTPSATNVLVPLENAMIRMLFILEKPGVTVTASDLPTDLAGVDSFHGIMKSANRGKYRILRDVMFTVVPKQHTMALRHNGNNTYSTVRTGLYHFDRTFKLKLNHEMRFADSSTAIPTNGHVSVWSIAERIAPDWAAASGINLMQSRMTFVDLPR